MKKLIDKINIEKIAYGFYLIDKGISLILNIVIVILIILVGVKSYSIEKYLNNNKEAIANYKWSISSIDFTNNISKDKNITKLGDKSIGKIVSFLNNSRVIIEGRGFDYDFNSDTEIDNFNSENNNDNSSSIDNGEGSLDVNNDSLNKSNVKSYDYITNKAIGKSLLAGKMIKSGIALLTVATVAGGLWQYLI